MAAHFGGWNIWPQSLAHPQPESVLYDTSSTLGMTDRDIVLRCLAAEEDPTRTTVGEIMTRGCATVSPKDDVREAGRIMAATQVRRLPVTEEGKVVGMVSLGDLATSRTHDMEASKALSDISDNLRKID